MGCDDDVLCLLRDEDLERLPENPPKSALALTDSNRITESTTAAKILRLIIFTAVLSGKIKPLRVL